MARSGDADRSETGDPPAFLRLASHPLRWQLLTMLGRSDHTVNELVALVGEAQNLVSYHLRVLREGGLVTARRSSADGRDSYYALDLLACRESFRAAGTALHPALVERTGGEHPRMTHRRRRTRVLFLCTGNSARSQMAEALTVHLTGGAVEARSAGSNPKPLHANAVRVMQRRGLDIADRPSKHLDRFVGQRFDAVITLCDRVRRVCPRFPNAAEQLHWSLPDPSLAGPDDDASYPVFERLAGELEVRIGFRFHPSTSAPHTEPRRSVHVPR